MPLQEDHKKFDAIYHDTNLKVKSLKGVAVTLSSQGLFFLIQTGSTMILARILTPKDYGIMAMIMTVTTFAGILSNLGLSTATIQRADVSHSQLSNLFWMNAGLGVCVTFVTACLSPAVAWFYHVPELSRVMLALSGNFLINGIGVQHRALLTRQMRFYDLAKIDMLSMLVGIAVAIFCACHGFGYWALVLSSICSTSVSTIGVWLELRWLPGLPMRHANVSSMLKYGSDIGSFNVINYFSRNLDNILIGRYYGGAELGIYSKAYQLLMVPITNLRDPLNKVALPTLSRLQDDPDQFRTYYRKLVSVLAFVSTPLVVLMFICADNIVGLLLGPQWLGSTDLFKILAVTALIQPVVSSCGVVMLSTGKSRKYFMIGAISAVLTSIAFIIGVHWGSKGVAIAYSIVNYILALPTLHYAFDETPISLENILSAIRKPFLSSIVMGIAEYFLINTYNNYSNISIIILSTTSCIAIYLTVYATIFDGARDIREYFSYIRVLMG